MNPLDEWLKAVEDSLGLTAQPVRDLVLDLTRDVAHGVSRPAAPVTAFLVGLAAGRDGGDAGAIRDAVAKVSELAGQWPSV